MIRTIAAAASVLVLVGSVPASAKDITVVASFTVLADMVQQVGGHHVHVSSLVGPNGDPHVYEPSPSDVNAISQAELVFVSGLGLEGWLDRLIAASGTKGKTIVVSDGITPRTMVDEDDGPTKGQMITDPHAWNSAANAVIYATNIEKALIAAAPEDAAAIKASGDRYIAQLQALDAWARQEIAAVPKAKRKVITSHDAFSYMGTAYGISFIAPQGISTEAEPTAAQVATLIKQIRAEKVKVVFLENQTDSRLAKQVAHEGGAKIGGALYPESLSTHDSPAATYVDAFTYNIKTLKAGMLAN